MLGNVAEWTRDAYWPRYLWGLREGDGLQLLGDSGVRSHRGGSAASAPSRLRCKARASLPPTNRMRDLGLRPMRPLDP